jgi:arginase
MSESHGEEARTAGGPIPVGVVENPYTGNTLAREYSEGPRILETGGLKDVLADLGCELRDVSSVQLTPGEDHELGNWNKMGHALRHLARAVARNQRQGVFPIGLLGNCSSLVGMLAGLQRSADLTPRRVGLVWIDAHGDFNTPETSLTGLMGGMPVAIAAGLCLTRLRLRAGLDPALPTRYITMAGLRNVYPFEQDLLDRSDVEFLSTEDIRRCTPELDRQMGRLGRLVDLIYVHVDMDVLDPTEVPGFNYPEPGGPRSTELGEALRRMFRHEKAAAFGVASTPYRDDTDGIARRAAYRLIEGVIRGLRDRRQDRADSFAAR